MRTIHRRLRQGPVAVALALFVVTAFAQPPTAKSIAPLVEQVAPAVVNITVRGDGGRAANPMCNHPFWGRMLPECRQFVGGGSGVIVDADKGLILTNAHVVANADEIQVTLRDERTLDATVVGADEPSDIAVIKIDANDLTEANLADSDKARVGDFVFAIGNPFGLNHTVTSGIISGLGRVTQDAEAYEDFIQTDASINPGNSGGALVNMDGQVVGINSAIYSPSGGNIGIGFAIPANMAQSIMDQLIDFGEVRRGLLGVNIAPFTPDLAEAYGVDEASGAIITEIMPESGADEAGLQAGDVIISINGKSVDDALELRNRIGLLREGEKIDVEYYRDGKRRKTTAVLGARSGARLASAQDLHPGLAGAEFVEIGSQDPSYGGTEGVAVASVLEDSPAAQRGLREGDLIVSVNRQRVQTIEEFRMAAGDGASLILGIRRGDSSVVLPIR